jgi:hypothetical protein
VGDGEGVGHGGLRGHGLQPAAVAKPLHCALPGRQFTQALPRDMLAS